jgi:phosphoglycolate phosphatase
MAASTLQLSGAGFGRINALVFDLDGTLIDSTAGVGNALSAAFQSAGRMMPAMDLRRVIGPPITVIARRIEPLLSDAEVAVIERSYRAIYDSNGWRDAFAYPAVADTLHIFHRGGLRLFIVTNKPLLPTSNILGHLGFDGLFLEALSRDSRTPHYANKTEMLADLLTRHQLLPDTTLMIGDTSEDQEAAHGNGLAFLHVTYGYGSVTTSTHRIDHFSEIATLLSATTTQENQLPQRAPTTREI